MRPPKSIPANRIASILILLTHLIGGCVTWRVETVPPAELVSSTRPPGELRVTRERGDRITLTSPRVIGDSLMGFREGRAVGVGLGEIREVATRHPATGKSVLLVLGVAAVVVVALSAIAGSSVNGLGY